MSSNIPSALIDPTQPSTLGLLSDCTPLLHASGLLRIVLYWDLPRALPCGFWKLLPQAALTVLNVPCDAGFPPEASRPQSGGTVLSNGVNLEDPSIEDGDACHSGQV